MAVTLLHVLLATLVLVATPPVGSSARPDPNSPDLLLVGDEVVAGVVVGIPGFDRLLLEAGERVIETKMPRLGLPNDAHRLRRQARSFLWERTYGDRVTVRIESHGPGEDRLTGRAFLDGADLRLALVEAGLALYCPGSRVERELEEATKRAREEHDGLWQGLDEPDRVEGFRSRACAAED